MTAPTPSAARAFCEAEAQREASNDHSQSAWRALPRFFTQQDALIYGYKAAESEYAAELEALRAKVAELEAERHDATGGVGRAITVEHLIDSHLYTASAVREVFVNTVRASGALAVDLTAQATRLADLERENERLHAQIVLYEQDVTRLNMELSKAQRMPPRRELTDDEIRRLDRVYCNTRMGVSGIEDMRAVINRALDILGATPAPTSLSDAECVALYEATNAWRFNDKFRGYPALYDMMRAALKTARNSEPTNG